MNRLHLRPIFYISSIMLLSLCLSATVPAQTSAFTYQGKLTDGGTPANGNYDLQFTLWDSLSGGAQIGSTLTLSTIAVSNGVFTVTLDFGAGAFPGADRFLEIGARASGAGAFTLLAPRQQFTVTPYAVRSLGSASADGLSSACALCVQDANINSVSGSKVSGAIPLGSVPAGSGNYIQNTSAPQASSNFNVSGNGIAGGTLSGNVINATTQYNIGGNRFASAIGTSNTFVGINAGSNTTGANNAFFGRDAGFSNTTGSGNAFFGDNAGVTNTTGINNSFFGQQAGAQNSTGFDNSFFGFNAGRANTTGNFNAFFGVSSGTNNTTGHDNAFFGTSAGVYNTTGNNNAFFGSAAGQNNTTGASNTFFGHNAGVANTTGSQNSFFGETAGEFTTGSPNAFFGYAAGHANTTGSYNTFFGWNSGSVNTTGGGNAFFGHQAGMNNTIAQANAFFGYQTGLNTTTGSNNAFFGETAGSTNTSGSNNVFVGGSSGQFNTTENNNTFVGFGSSGAPGITNATAIGANASVTQSNSLVLGSINGANGATANTNVGVGMSSFPALNSPLLSVASTSRDNGGITVGGNGTNEVLYLYANTSTNYAGIQVKRPNISVDNLALQEQGGNVGIGTTAPAVALQVIGDIRLGTSGTNGCVQRFDGTAVAGACSSDIRFKRDVRPFPSLLDKISRLQPVHYYWRSNEYPDKHFGNSQSYGLIAQDVERVLPELVGEDTQGYKTVDYSKLPLMMLQAIRELKAENDTLRQQNAAMEGRLKSIEGAIQQKSHRSSR